MPKGDHGALGGPRYPRTPRCAKGGTRPGLGDDIITFEKYENMTKSNAVNEKSTHLVKRMADEYGLVQDLHSCRLLRSASRHDGLYVGSSIVNSDKI